MPGRGSLGAGDKPVQPVNNRLLSLLRHVGDYSNAELWWGLAWWWRGPENWPPIHYLPQAQRSSAHAPMIGHLTQSACPERSPWHLWFFPHTNCWYKMQSGNERAVDRMIGDSCSPAASNGRAPPHPALNTLLFPWPQDRGGVRLQRGTDGSEQD